MRRKIAGCGRVTAAGGVVLAALSGVAACAAAGSSVPGPSGMSSAVSSTRAGSAGAGVLSVLRSIPDTAGNRSSITVNEVSAIWTAAGLPTTPSAAQAMGKTGQDATTQVFEGSPAGTGLWRVAPNYSAPLGYPVLSVKQEIAVGSVGDQVSEVWAPVSTAAVARAVQPLRLGTAHAGANVLYDLGPGVNVSRPAPFDEILLGTRYLLVPSSGGRIITGSGKTPQSALTALANGTPVPDSLAADPDVAAMIGALGPAFQSLTIGTFSPTPSEMFTHLTPLMLARVKRVTGLGRLRSGPVMTGLAYSGGPVGAQSVVAAALYPSPADAQSAADTMVPYTAAGTSLRLGQPYSKLWRVDKTSVLGRLVIMHLTTMSPGSVTQALLTSDFPLFWSPA